MSLWRIIDRGLVREAFSGQGACNYGGRWNSPGARMIYCSEHPALAALEKLVHIQDMEQLRQSYALISVDCPPELAETLSERLPRNWAGDGGRPKLRRIGDQWIASRRSLALIVPSVVLPRSSNILVNPLHPAFGQLHIGRPESFDSTKIANRGTKVTASRVTATVIQLFLYAVERDYIESSPVQFFRRPGGQKRPRQRALSELAAYLKDPTEATRYRRLSHVINAPIGSEA